MRRVRPLPIFGKRLDPAHRICFGAFVGTGFFTCSTQVSSLARRNSGPLELVLVDQHGDIGSATLPSAQALVSVIRMGVANAKLHVDVTKKLIDCVLKGNIDSPRPVT